MADALGFEGMHGINGFACDYCGKGCDPEAQELNALDCTFGQCPSKASVYHQDCLETWLKSLRLEKCARQKAVASRCATSFVVRPSDWWPAWLLQKPQDRLQVPAGQWKGHSVS